MEKATLGSPVIHAALEQATGVVQQYLLGRTRSGSNQLRSAVRFKLKPPTLLKLGAGRPPLLSSGLARRRQPRKRSSAQVVAAGLGLTFMIWNWQLLLASSLGVGTMVYLYRLPRHAQEQLWAQLLDLSQTVAQLLQQALHTPKNTPLLLAVGGGSVVALNTYLLTLMGAETGGVSTVMLTLQGWAILGLGVVLLGQLLQKQTAGQEQRVDQLLANLSHAEPLQRLIAVRQLQRLRRLGQLDASQRQLLSEAFRLLLAKERQIIIRNALLEACPEPRPRRIRRSALPAALSGQREVTFEQEQVLAQKPIVEYSITDQGK